MQWILLLHKLYYDSFQNWDNVSDIVSISSSRQHLTHQNIDVKRNKGCATFLGNDFNAVSLPSVAENKYSDSLDIPLPRKNISD